MLLLQVEHVLSCCDLGGDVAAGPAPHRRHHVALMLLHVLQVRCASWYGGSIVVASHDLSIDYGRRILPVVKVLHLFVHVVFLADFGA